MRTKRAYNNSPAWNRKNFPAPDLSAGALNELLDLASLIAFVFAICMVRA